MAWISFHRENHKAPWNISLTTSILKKTSIDFTSHVNLNDISVNTAISKLLSNNFDPLWTLELAKSIDAHQWTIVLEVISIVDYLVSAEGHAYHVSLTEQEELPAYERALLYMLNLNSIKRRRFLRGVSTLSASVLIWLLLCLKNVSMRTKVPKFASTTLAVNAEVSNRTRHVLAMDNKVVEHGSPILIIGQVRAKLANITKDFKAQYPERHFDLLRPLDLISVVSSLPKACRHLLYRQADFNKFPFSLSLTERIKINIRFLQGFAHQHWWRHVKLPPNYVIFGHTGLADTTMLEYQMQAESVKTVHYVHGTSHGWNFAGHSDIGFFSSGFDADLATKVKGYKKTTYARTTMPVPKFGGEKWALLTSYSHPMNPVYKKKGVSADIGIMTAVTIALKKQGTEARNILWRPHPIIGQLSDEDRCALYDCANELDITLWPNDLPYSSMRNLSGIITTPSTAVFDCLRFGKVPLVFSTDTIQSDLIYAHLPTLVSSVDELERMILFLNNEEDYRKRFEAIWHIVRPGGKLGLLH